jgi:1-deoxyxylulose-5-phosphate synthase
MRFRSLGNTGLQISEVSLGAAEIGLDYGFKGSANYARPEPSESIRLIHRALDLGINLIDTARTYGTSEEIIGMALKGAQSSPYIVSKVQLSPEAEHKNSTDLRREIFTSLETSLKALQRESIDLLLVHNPNLQCACRQEVTACLEEARQQGKVRFVGASPYDEETALVALRQPLFCAIQVPFNLLNQSMSRKVFALAEAQGVGVFVRSAYLRGVLTSQVHSVPERLFPLKAAALRSLQLLKEEVGGLAEAALRFCLSYKAVSSVVIGVKTIAELETNVADSAKGPLAAKSMPELESLSFAEDPLVDTRAWQDLI